MAAYKVGEWTVQPNLNRLVREEKTVKLEPKVLALLNCFAKHPGEVLNRDDLIKVAWDGVIVSENTINYTISMLRRALGDTAKERKYIQTVAKKGYRLVAEVSEEKPAESAEAPTAPPVTETITQQKDTPAIETKPHESATALSKALLILGVLIAITLISIIFWPEKAPGLKLTQSTPITTMPGDEFAISTDSAGETLYFSHIKKGDPFSDIYRLPVTGGIAELAMPATPNRHETSPALSPDGSLLAYATFGDDGCTMFLHRFNSEEPDEELAKCGPYLTEISWTSDQSFFFIAADSNQAPASIQQLNINSGKINKITDHSEGVGDYAFKLSDTGQQMALFRTQDWNETQLIVRDMQSGEETTLTSFPGWSPGLAWLYDDQLIAFMPERTNTRIDAYHLGTGDIHTLYSQSKGLKIATGIKGTNKLIAIERTWDTNIHKVERASAVDALKNDPAAAIIASTRGDWQPKISPDGTSVAFFSKRTGASEIWSSDLDGGSIRQLSQLEGDLFVHTLAWNASGDTIAFDTFSNRVYVLDITSGTHKALTPSSMAAKNPTFTPDGKHVVFASDKSGDWQLWQVPAVGGSPIKLTTGGGYSAKFGTDGMLYIAKYYKGGVWRLDLTTREETLFAPDVTIAPMRQWVLRDGGVYYGQDHEGRVQLFFYDFARRTSEVLFDTPHYAYTFEVSHDEKLVFFTRDESKGGDIILLE